MHSSAFVVADVVEVNVIMGASMGSLVADAVMVDVITVIMDLGMQSLVSCFAVKSSHLAVVEVFIWML